MSARQPRFEIVRTAVGWTARFRASNGPILMSSGRQVYSRRRGAVRAVFIMAEAFWDDGFNARVSSLTDPAGTVFITSSDGDYVEVRDVDERGAPSQRPLRAIAWPGDPSWTAGTPPPHYVSQL